MTRMSGFPSAATFQCAARRRQAFYAERLADPPNILDGPITGGVSGIAAKASPILATR
jgi:hypothetical protein